MGLSRGFSALLRGRRTLSGLMTRALFRALWRLIARLSPGRLLGGLIRFLIPRRWRSFTGLARLAGGRHGRTLGRVATIGLTAPAFVLGLPYLAGMPGHHPRASTDYDHTAWAVCQGRNRAARGASCVVDGDTFWIEGEKIRLAGVDTPELSRPGCPLEHRRATAARDALVDILSSGTVAIDRQNQDRYGRTLARVRVDGRDVGRTLMRNGYAQAYPKRVSWCATAI